MENSRKRRSLADQLRDKLEVETRLEQNIFSEEPVPLDVFLKDKKFMGSGQFTLGEHQYNLVRHMEQIYLPEMYPYLVENFGSSWAPVRHVNYITVAWGKGCLAGDSELYNSKNGLWEKVSSLCNVSGFVQGFDIKTRASGVETRTPTFIQGKGQSSIVRTQSGNEIHVFNGHSFVAAKKSNKKIGRLYRDFIPAKIQLRDLEVGNYIAAPSYLHCTDPVSQNPNEIELLGFLLGDGCVVKGSTPSLTVALTEPAIADRYEQLAQSVVTPKSVVPVRDIPKLGTGRMYVFMRRTKNEDGSFLFKGKTNEFTEYVKEVLGIYGCKAHDKFIPTKYFSMPDNQIALLLARLMDTDGSFYEKTSKTVSSKYVAEYTTVSKQLALDIQRLMLRLGIIASRRLKKTSHVYKGEKKFSTAWVVEAKSRKSFMRMVDVVVPLMSEIPKKAKALKLAEAYYAIPSLRENKETFEHYYWDRIVSIEPAGELEYWNLTCDTTHTYVSNSLFHFNSGKDFAVQIAVARIANLLLCLKSPQLYYDLSGQSDIHILNVAMNAAQAHRAFFRPLSSSLSKSPWFKDKLTSEPSDQAKSIRLIKQIELISGHSAVENFEGLSPIAVVLDEISGFQSENQKASRGVIESQRTAEAVYDIVRTSAATRFPESFKVAAISYPRYLNDPIQTLCKAGMADIEEFGLENSRYFVDGPRTTWEVNPRYKKYELIKVDGTNTLIPNVPAFISDYRTDPEMAKAKYECLPQRASNRYFRNDAAIADAFPKQDENTWVEPLTIRYFWGVDNEGAAADNSYELATVPGWQAIYEFAPGFKPMEGAVYALHADLAISGDRAGISMCHVKNWERREHVMGEPGTLNPNLQTDDRPVIKVDFVTSYEADLTAISPESGEVKARQIQIRWFRNLIRELKRRGFIIGLVTFDNFQSQDSIQILEMWGIASDVLSMDRNKIPYATLREVMYDGRLECYYRETVVQEIEGLSELSTGKIDHAPGASKDEADALCGAVCGALSLGGDEGQEPEIIDAGLVSTYEVRTNFGENFNIWGNMDFSSSAWGI